MTKQSIPQDTHETLQDFADYAPPAWPTNGADAADGKQNGHAPQRTQWQTGASAVWRNRDYDQPVVIAGVAGVQNGVTYYRVEGSTTGIPEHELQPTAQESVGAAPSVADPDDLLHKFSANGAQPHGHAAQEDSADAAPDAEAQVEALRTEEALAYWTPRAYTVDTFLQRPPKEWLVDKVLGVQDFCLMYGESGHGKTHAALDFAYACATGANTFADTFPITRQLTVAYATGEGLGGLADRLRAVSSYYGAVDVPLYLFADIPQLFEHTQENGAHQFARAWQAMAENGTVPAQLDVLILDTLHNSTAGADENSAKDAAIVQRAMRYLRDTLGCAIVLVHHANKAGTSERGSSALRASCDTVLRAQKLGKAYTLSCEKLKDAETWPALSFDLVSVNGCTSVRVFWQGQAQTLTQNTGKRLEARVLSHLDSHKGQRYTAEEVAQAIEEDSRTATQNTLKTLRQAGAILSVKEDRQTKDGKTRSVFVYWQEDNTQVEATAEDDTQAVENAVQIQLS